MNDFPKMNMTRMRFLLLVESLLLLATPSRCQDENTIIERPVDYVDDVYHCEDPQLVYDFVGNTNDTISCDPITWKWNVEELDVSEPPFICEGVENLQTLQEQTPVVDWLEPCILWGMIHGDFTPGE